MGGARETARDRHGPFGGPRVVRPAGSVGGAGVAVADPRLRDAAAFLLLLALALSPIVLRLWLLLR